MSKKLIIYLSLMISPIAWANYSDLTQITPQNVKNLKVAWIYHTGDKSNGSKKIRRTAFEATPIFWQNKLYFCTPFNRIVSLDAKTGQRLWDYQPKGLDLSREYIGPTHCRGVTLWTDNKTSRIFEGVNDGRLIAVDANTGQPVKDFGNQGEIDLNKLPNFSNKPSIFLTSSPIVYKDLVITGSAINDNQYGNSPHGFVYAFDVHTGKLKWAWDPIPKELANTVGGVNSWAPLTLDNNTGILYVPTGSPSNDYFGGARTQPIPYENSLVALDANTGKVLWSFQTVHHNLWDYDLPSPPALIDIQKNGKTILAVAQATKTNFIFFLDRLTGKPIYPVKEQSVPISSVPGEITSPIQPMPEIPKPLNKIQMSAQDAFGMVYFDKLWCENQIKKLDNQGIFTPPSLKGALALPGPMGGNNWGGTAFDPDTHLLIVNTSNVAGVVQLFPRDEYATIKKLYPAQDVSPMHGTPYGMRRTFLLSPLGVPCTPPPWGKLSAVDVNTGEIKWEIPFGGVRKGFFVTPKKWGSPTLGGPLVTKSGLIFIGASMDNLFHIYDLKTGELLLEKRLPADGIATPMSYEVDGKQYVVIAAGGGRISTTQTSDALMAYALP